MAGACIQCAPRFRQVPKIRPSGVECVDDCEIVLPTEPSEPRGRQSLMLGIHRTYQVWSLSKCTHPWSSTAQANPIRSFKSRLSSVVLRAGVLVSPVEKRADGEFIADLGAALPVPEWIHIMFCRAQEIKLPRNLVVWKIIRWETDWAEID